MAWRHTVRLLGRATPMLGRSSARCTASGGARSQYKLAGDRDGRTVGRSATGEAAPGEMPAQPTKCQLGRRLRTLTYAAQSSMH